jgi:hypothetical protein
MLIGAMLKIVSVTVTAFRDRAFQFCIPGAGKSV